MTNQNESKLTLPNDDAGPLTVADLITLLQAMPPDLGVAVSGYDGGYSPVTAILQKTLLENVNDESYYGPHDNVDSIPEYEITERKLTKADYIIFLP